MNLRIKRIDGECCNKVRIKSKNFTLKLKPCGNLLLQWSQPFYENGNWEILKLDQVSKNKVLKSNNNPPKPTGHNMSHLYLV